MPALRRCWLAAGAWLLCTVASGAVHDSLDACIAQAAADLRGIVALESACPGLRAALDESGVAANLPAGWQDSLDREALRDIAALDRRYQDTPDLAPDSSGLPSILEQLASEQTAPSKSWWDAAKAWLRSWFARPQRAGGSWFRDFLDRIAESRDLIQVITYLLLSIAVVAALAFIINELRIAGVFAGRREPGRRSRQVAHLPSASPQPEDLIDLDAATPAEQPAILLRLLVARLVARGRLSGERSLTHRELIARAAWPDPQGRTLFARVAQLAECMLYGPGAPDGEEVRAVVADGRSLLQQLQAAGETRP